MRRVWTYPGADCNSDHILLIDQLQTDLKKLKSRKAELKLQCNLLKEDAKVMAEFCRKVEERLDKVEMMAISETDCLGFSPAREFSQTLSRFSPGYEGTENILLSFRLNKKKGDIRSVCVYFSLFNEIVNFYNLETASYISHIIFMLYCAMKTDL